MERVDAFDSSRPRLDLDIKPGFICAYENVCCFVLGKYVKEHI